MWLLVDTVIITCTDIVIVFIFNREMTRLQYRKRSGRRVVVIVTATPTFAPGTATTRIVIGDW